MQMTDEQLKLITTKLSTIKDCSPFYAEKFKDIDPSDVRTQEDFEKLPFSEKDDLRRVYPLGLQAVPDEEVVRIHSSSGTTGTPVIIPYTAQDVTDWAIQFERCYRTAGITNLDRIQITPGYGLWTAGIGFQLGCERLGAMAIPMGPGNTEKQLKMMQDLHSTVITGTSSYALLLAEEISTRGLRDKLDLKKGVIGSERWGEKMRHRIANELGIEIFDIYGLTEIYGPGIGISCERSPRYACLGRLRVRARSSTRRRARCCPTARWAKSFSPRCASRARRSSATARTTFRASSPVPAPANTVAITRVSTPSSAAPTTW